MVPVGMCWQATSEKGSLFWHLRLQASSHVPRFWQPRLEFEARGITFPKDCTIQGEVLSTGHETAVLKPSKGIMDMALGGRAFALAVLKRIQR